MAMKIELLDNGWKMIYSENADGDRTIWDLTGEGETFSVPRNVVEIRKRAFTRINCPNLKQVWLGHSVQKIQQDAFDGFGTTLEIYCELPMKPAGYFEGEYEERFKDDDGGYYFFTHYGSWLHRSVVVRSIDGDGNITWLSNLAKEEIAIRPRVSWGAKTLPGAEGLQG